MTGPLHGLHVVEIAGLGPAPFAAMMLADAGAEVLRINRPGQSTEDAGILGRSRSASITLDLKDPADLQIALDEIREADVLIEGFRPGVMERLGLGPESCLNVNRGLVYARVTGWGRTGPLAASAGHDINYLAMTGVLRSIARDGETPVPPLNLVGDYGGGGMLLLNGILAALYECSRSGRGQVVDAAMVDGASLLMAGVWNRVGHGSWTSQPGTNSIDTGSHFYNVYRTADDEFMAVGSIEAPFYRRLLQGLGLDPAIFPDQHDRDAWPVMKRTFAEIFATRTRAEWTVVFADLDACVTPVLGIDEAQEHPQIRSRGTLLTRGRTQPAPAPRYGRTPCALPVVERGLDDATALATGIGFTEGPVWTPDGRLFVTSLSRGAIYEVFLDGRPAVLVAEPGAGPNGMTFGHDGRLWITQNGGGVVPSRSSRQTPPSIQVWDPDGRLEPETVLHTGVGSPSDCTFGPDLALWFTDPDGHGFGDEALPGRVWRYDPGTAAAAVMLDDVYFPNGIAFGADPTCLYVAETARDRVRRYLVTGDRLVRDSTAPDLTVSTPDGIAADEDGGLWVAGSKSGVVSHFDSSGRLTQRIDIGARTLPTSVCFAGPGLKTLIVTVAKGGRVLAFDIDTPGLAVPSQELVPASASTLTEEPR